MQNTLCCLVYVYMVIIHIYHIEVTQHNIIANLLYTYTQQEQHI